MSDASSSPETDAEARSGFDPERFMRMMRKVGHPAALGLRYRGHGQDWAELELDQDPRLVGVPEHGIIASGPIVSLMDTASSLAIWVRIDRFAWTATLDLRVDYLRPALPGKLLVGHGQCYKVTRNVAFVRGTAHDGDPDDPVAHIAGTFMFIQGG